MVCRLKKFEVKAGEVTALQSTSNKLENSPPVEDLLSCCVLALNRFNFF